MDSELLDEVRISLAEVVGVDEREISSGHLLADDLGMGAFELDEALARISRKLRVRVTLLDVLAHAREAREPVHLDGRPWLDGDTWLVMAEGACSFCTVNGLAEAAQRALDARLAQPAG